MGRARETLRSKRARSNGEVSLVVALTRFYKALRSAEPADCDQIDSLKMSGFIMTLDSDDDAPRSPSPVPVLGSTSRASTSALTARDSLKPAKKGKQTKKQRQKAQRTAIEADSGDDEPAQVGRGGADDSVAMSSGFVFDGLGGGFVGRDRHSVWVSRRAPELITAVTELIAPSLCTPLGLRRGLHPDATERHGELFSRC